MENEVRVETSICNNDLNCKYRADRKCSSNIERQLDQGRQQSIRFGDVWKRS